MVTALSLGLDKHTNRLKVIFKCRFLEPFFDPRHMCKGNNLQSQNKNLYWKHYCAYPARV